MDFNCWYQPRGPLLLWGEQVVPAEPVRAILASRGGWTPFGGGRPDVPGPRPPGLPIGPPEPGTVRWPRRADSRRAPCREAATANAKGFKRDIRSRLQDHACFTGPPPPWSCFASGTGLAHPPARSPSVFPDDHHPSADWVVDRFARDSGAGGGRSERRDGTGESRAAAIAGCSWSTSTMRTTAVSSSSVALLDTR